MSTLNDSHPFLLLSEQLAEICKPLEAFGIHHFTYLKQYQNGDRISLSNKPKWIEDYYNLNLHQSSLFEDSVQGSAASFNLWFGDYDLEVYRHGKMYFNTMHSISIVEHKKTSCESYLFATTPDNSQAIHYLSNNREILYHFIMYLKDRGKLIFKQAEKHKMHVINQRDSASQKYTEWLQSPEWAQKMDAEKSNFFAATPIHRFTFEDRHVRPVNFTQRELLCIKHLLDHRTAAETAALLSLSARTVESYLNNIKSKLGCASKIELITTLKNSPYLYLSGKA